jgi:O-methyltransferase involved in polyketide biosynthesis
VAGLLINEGIFGASPSEPVLEVIEKVKRRFADATSVLDACDREQRMSAGKRPTLLVYRIVCMDQDAMQWGEDDIGNLRVALNALVRLFRI